MALAILDAEGTWDEISERVGDWRDTRVHVIVLPAADDSSSSSDARPMADVLAEIASSMPSEELAQVPADLTDNLDQYIYGSPAR